MPDAHPPHATPSASLPRRLAAALAGGAISVLARIVTAPRVVFQAPIPKDRQVVYFANHTSNADTVLIWTALGHRRRTTRPVAAADYWLASSLRRFIGLDVFRILPIERHAERRRADPVQEMSRAVEQGASLIIFPEGRRNDTEATLLDLKPGIYHLAREHPSLAFVPVWIDNLGGVMPRGEIVPVPLICSLTFGTALQLGADETRDAFMARARSALLDLGPGSITPDDRAGT